MRYLVMLNVIIFTISCGHTRQVNVHGFETYLDAFIDDARSNGVILVVDDLRIKFDDNLKADSETGYQVGVCRLVKADDGTLVETPEISVDTQFWLDSSSSIKKALLYHELGHCVLMQDHRDDIRSVMNSYIVMDYNSDIEYYNAELFSFGTPEHDAIKVEITHN